MHCNVLTLLLLLRAVPIFWTRCVHSIHLHVVGHLTKHTTCVYKYINVPMLCYTTPCTQRSICINIFVVFHICAPTWLHHKHISRVCLHFAREQWEKRGKKTQSVCVCDHHSEHKRGATCRQRSGAKMSMPARKLEVCTLIPRTQS